MELVKIEDILKEWEKDSQIDITEPSREIIRIPTVHSKYLNIMTKHRLSYKRASHQLASLRKIKWEYYTGKMSKEQLHERGWDPFPFTLKADVATYMESDDDIIKLLEKRAYHEEAITACESILKELNNRTWQLREHMTHERFIQGAR